MDAGVDCTNTLCQFNFFVIKSISLYDQQFMENIETKHSSNYCTRQWRSKEWIIYTLQILWQLWKARNKKVFESVPVDALRIVQKAHGEWLEFDHANAEDKNTKCRAHEPEQHCKQWEPPKEGIMRINTDAAISAQMIRTGKGIIARDWTGKIIKATGLVELKKGAAEMEEILAVRATLLMAKNAGWTQIEVQLDCKIVVDQITSGADHNGSLSTILEDIKDLRSSSLLVHSLLFIEWEISVVTH